MSTPLVLTIDHPAVRLCAAHRFTSRAKALAILNDFDVERARWCAVAREAVAIREGVPAEPAIPRSQRDRYLEIIADLTERVMGETP